MTGIYEPELGQMAFGQPSQAFDCPPILEAALGAVREDLERVSWNREQQEIDPFANEGSSFRCPVFAVCSYSWNDDKPQPWNFKHFESGTELSWYKYFGRGMSVNRKIIPDAAAGLLRECLDALQLVESGAMTYDRPGLYPDEVPVA